MPLFRSWDLIVHITSSSRNKSNAILTYHTVPSSLISPATFFSSPVWSAIMFLLKIREHSVLCWSINVYRLSPCIWVGSRVLCLVVLTSFYHWSTVRCISVKPFQFSDSTVYTIFGSIFLSLRIFWRLSFSSIDFLCSVLSPTLLSLLCGLSEAFDLCEDAPFSFLRLDCTYHFFK